MQAQEPWIRYKPFGLIVRRAFKNLAALNRCSWKTTEGAYIKEFPALAFSEGQRLVVGRQPPMTSYSQEWHPKRPYPHQSKHAQFSAQSIPAAGPAELPKTYIRWSPSARCGALEGVAETELTV